MPYTTFQLKKTNGTQSNVTLRRLLTYEELDELFRGDIARTFDSSLIEKILGHSSHGILSITAVEPKFVGSRYKDVLLRNTGLTKEGYAAALDEKEKREEIRKRFPGDQFFCEEDLPEHLRSSYLKYAGEKWTDLKLKDFLKKLVVEKGPMTKEKCPSLLQIHWKTVLSLWWNGTLEGEREVGVDQGKVVKCPACQKSFYKGMNFGKFCRAFNEEGVLRKICSSCK